MSILSVSPTELQQVESSVNSVRGELKGVAVPSSPGAAAFGFPDLTNACRAFVKDEKERIRGVDEWCEDTVDALRFTSQHIGDTDQQVADEFAKKGDSLADVLKAYASPSPWGAIFSWEPDRYQ